MHAPHLLATAAAKGLFWEGMYASLAAGSLVWRSAARQQLLFGSEVMGGGGVKAAFVPLGWPASSPNEPLGNDKNNCVCVWMLKMRRVHWRETLHGGQWRKAKGMC